jgi:cytochrome c-type biogenesis protein CcmE
MRRNAKLIVAFLLVAASAGLVLWSTSAATTPPALGVSEAKQRAATLEGQTVTVRGNVVEGTIEESDGRVLSFVVEDHAERLRVLYGRPPPDNFGAKQVVLTGAFGFDAEGTPIFHAESIQVGCASKY